MFVELVGPIRVLTEALSNHPHCTPWEALRVIFVYLCDLFGHSVFKYLVSPCLPPAPCLTLVSLQPVDRVQWILIQTPFDGIHLNIDDDTKCMYSICTIDSFVFFFFFFFFNVFYIIFEDSFIHYICGIACLYFPRNPCEFAGLFGHKSNYL